VVSNRKAEEITDLVLDMRQTASKKQNGPTSKLSHLDFTAMEANPYLMKNCTIVLLSMLSACTRPVPKDARIVVAGDSVMA